MLLFFLFFKISNYCTIFPNYLFVKITKNGFKNKVDLMYCLHLTKLSEQKFQLLKKMLFVLKSCRKQN